MICALRLRSSASAHSVKAAWRSAGSRKRMRTSNSAMTTEYTILIPSCYCDTITISQWYQMNGMRKKVKPLLGYENREQRRQLGGLSRNWNPSISAFIWDRDRSRCVYCGEKALQIDHVVPRHFGGPTITANGVLACRTCNTRKGNSLSIETLTHAFSYLLRHHEELTWVEHLWLSTRESVYEALEKVAVVPEVKESWD